MRDKTLASLAISDSGYIFNPQTGNSYLVGNVGAVVLDAMKKGYSTEEICCCVEDRYEVPSGTNLEEDIGHFIFQLQREGLTCSQDDRALSLLEYVETPTVASRLRSGT